MIPKPLPTDHVLVGLPLTAEDALWGYERGWLGWPTLVKLADKWIEQSERPDPSILDLATLSKVNASEAGFLLRRIADLSTSDAPSTSSKKWLYLAMRSLWERETDRAASLYLVSEVAAEFGYPEEIESIDPMMPVLDGTWNPSEHSLEENRERLYRLWMSYLRAAGSQFGISWEPGL